jgi:hypothetical protein
MGQPMSAKTEDSSGVHGPADVGSEMFSPKVDIIQTNECDTIFMSVEVFCMSRDYYSEGVLRRNECDTI